MIENMIEIVMNQQVLGRFQKGLAQYYKDFNHIFYHAKPVWNIKLLRQFQQV
jgi:hypothetical protein